MNFEVNSRQKVTAGIPGLLPDVRDKADKFNIMRDYQHALFDEKESKKKAAIAPDGKRPTTDREAQRGIALHGSVLMSRLKQLNSNLWFEVALADSTKMGCYYLDPLAEGGRRFIVGFYREMNPEFTTILHDDNGECNGTIRGWRTVISRLIRKGFISEPKAFVLFGPPSKDSEKWQTLTQ